eukprot:scaffold95883_cov35-Tisochrysis_lutea.AAC.2
MIYKDGMPPFGLIGCSAAASSLASATILRNLWLERPLEVWLRAPRCPPQPTLFRAGGDWRPASAIGVKLERARRSRGVGARSAGEFLACSCCAIDSLRAFFNACSSVSDGGGTTDRSRNSTSSSRLRCSCSVCASRSGCFNAIIGNHRKFLVRRRTSSNAARKATITALPRSPLFNVSAVRAESAEVALEAVGGREVVLPVAPVDPVGGRAVEGREPPELGVSGRMHLIPAEENSSSARVRECSTPVVVAGLRGSASPSVSRSKPCCLPANPRISRSDDLETVGCAVRGRRGNTSASPRID